MRFGTAAATVFAEETSVVVVDLITILAFFGFQESGCYFRLEEQALSQARPSNPFPRRLRLCWRPSLPSPYPLPRAVPQKVSVRLFEQGTESELWQSEQETVWQPEKECEVEELSEELEVKCRFGTFVDSCKSLDHQEWFIWQP